MKKTTMGSTKRRPFIWIILVLAALVQCGGALPATNPVQSIAIGALDELLAAEDFSGLVAFMATWCPPCRKELPDLAKLHGKYKDKGINIVAISVDEDVAAVQPLVNKLKIPFPVYWVGTKGIEKYQLVGIPTLFVVRQGNVLEKLPGVHRRSTLENKIKKLM